MQQQNQIHRWTPINWWENDGGSVPFARRGFGINSAPPIRPRMIARHGKTKRPRYERPDTGREQPVFLG